MYSTVSFKIETPVVYTGRTASLYIVQKIDTRILPGSSIRLFFFLRPQGKKSSFALRSYDEKKKEKKKINLKKKRIEKKLIGLQKHVREMLGPFKCLFKIFVSDDHFKNCHPNVAGFDVCVREGLNAIRSYFKTGLPEYNVEPFDPAFAREISVERGMRNFGFTLTLKNVTETGWANSKVTKFVSDIPNYKVF